MLERISALITSSREIIERFMTRDILLKLANVMAFTQLIIIKRMTGRFIAIVMGN